MGVELQASELEELAEPVIAEAVRATINVSPVQQLRTPLYVSFRSDYCLTWVHKTGCIFYADSTDRPYR